MTAPPLNYSTKVSASRTTGECQQLLADAGAEAVAVIFNAGEPVGMTFRMTTLAGSGDFTLPVDVAGVHRILKDATYPAGWTVNQIARFVSREHASRVAWRIVKDWLEAQLAIIAAGMVTLDEIMLPYLAVGGGRTLRDVYREGGPRAIGPAR